MLHAFGIKNFQNNYIYCSSSTKGRHIAPQFILRGRSLRTLRHPLWMKSSTMYLQRLWWRTVTYLTVTRWVSGESLSHEVATVRSLHQKLNVFLSASAAELQLYNIDVNLVKSTLHFSIAWAVSIAGLPVSKTLVPSYLHQVRFVVATGLKSGRSKEWTQQFDLWTLATRGLPGAMPIPCCKLIQIVMFFICSAMAQAGSL
jgi:hypothetical protein